MNISVVVVSYNEEENIGACLDSILAQDYRAGDYEIIVVDGASSDETAEIVRNFTALHPGIRLFTEPKRGTAAARNTGIHQARYEFIAYTDADCEARPDWLENLARAWREAAADDDSVRAAGGAAVPPESVGSFPRAIKIALNTYLGSGGRVSGKFHPRKRYVADLPSLNVIYPRELFEKIGYFSENLRSEGEDAEFSYRILKAGFKLAYDPRPLVFHKYRPTPRGWWRNMLRYGRARGTLIVRYPVMLNPLYAAPAILVILLALTPIGLLNPLFLLPLVYFPLVFIQSLYASIRAGQPLLVFHVFLAICLTHIAYGIGLITRVCTSVLSGGRAGNRDRGRHFIGR